MKFGVRRLDGALVCVLITHRHFEVMKSGVKPPHSKLAYSSGTVFTPTLLMMRSR